MALKHKTSTFSQLIRRVREKKICKNSDWRLTPTHIASNTLGSSRKTREPASFILKFSTQTSFLMLLSRFVNNVTTRVRGSIRKGPRSHQNKSRTDTKKYVRSRRCSGNIVKYDQTFLNLFRAPRLGAHKKCHFIYCRTRQKESFMLLHVNFMQTLLLLMQVSDRNPQHGSSPETHSRARRGCVNEGWQK